MYGIVEGEWDWTDNVNMEQVGGYIERAAPHVVDAIQGGGLRDLVNSPSEEVAVEEAKSGFRFDWKWGAAAVAGGGLLFWMLRRR